MCQVELQSLANIIQGNIPTRIEVTTGQSVETITMQELNYIANVSDDLPIAKYITVQGDKNRNLLFNKRIRRSCRIEFGQSNRD